MRTSMQIYSGTLEKLHALKGRGQSYDDVVNMLLQVYYESNTVESNK